jgi:hypothetical protein
MHKSANNYILESHGSTACAKLKVGHFVGNNMYKTPSNFHIGMRGGAPELCLPLKIIFTDWHLIPLDVRMTRVQQLKTKNSNPEHIESSIEALNRLLHQSMLKVVAPR